MIIHNAIRKTLLLCLKAFLSRKVILGITFEDKPKKGLSQTLPKQTSYIVMGDKTKHDEIPTCEFSFSPSQQQVMVSHGIVEACQL